VIESTRSAYGYIIIYPQIHSIIIGRRNRYIRKQKIESFMVYFLRKPRINSFYLYIKYIVYYILIVCRSKKDTQRPDVYRVDHHYPGSENLSSVAILYGELGSPDLVPLHKVLETAAKAKVVDYILRAFVKERPNQRVRLSGYGVELQIKSTEYKVRNSSVWYDNVRS